jgi:hypothetical protein
MHALKFVLGLSILGGFAAMTAVKPADAATRHPAHLCGENMYHHNGTCVDARDHDSASWSDRMSAKRAQW